MKIKKLFILFITLLHTSSLLPAARPWLSRAIPLSFNQHTNEWNVLLGHNVSNDFWSDFGLPGRRGPDAQQVAQTALSQQTNGMYNVSIQGAPWKRDGITGDIYHFVVVPYKPGRDLYTGRNQVKDDFVWLPAKTIMQLRIKKSIRHKNHPKPISQGFHQLFKKEWPNIEQQLAGAAGAGAGAPITPSAVTSWFQVSNKIMFYQSGQPYFEFTNVVIGYPINVNGTIWPSTEQYFQAQKFPGNAPAQQQLLAQSGAAVQQTAQQLAQQYGIPQNWHTQLKFQAMLTAVRAKFNQHASLRKMLLGTNNNVLIENAGARDAEWGAGADGKGNNHLGRMLMLVRKELRDGKQYIYDPQTTLSLAQLAQYGFDPAAALNALYGTPGRQPTPTPQPTPAPQPGKPTDLRPLARDLAQLQAQLDQLAANLQGQG